MVFPLYRRPGGVVFLDDDPDYIEMLAEVMPADWYVRVFLRPVACIALLLKESSLWESDAWAQQEIVNRWREGASLIPQILAYWREDGARRFGLAQVCVVDYSMPAMSGLQVLRELEAWSGARILLTGRVDEQLAISAFNRGLIERFIPKQSPELRLQLENAIQSLFCVPNPRHEQTWRATLSRKQDAFLCNPAIAQALENLALAQGWVEHVVIGAPFGVLALDKKAALSWLQLEPTDNLRELAEIAQAQGSDASTVQNIQAGKKLIDLELQLALGSQGPPELRNAFRLGSDSNCLHAAIFPIEKAFSPHFISSHEHFVANLGERRLQD